MADWKHEIERQERRREKGRDVREESRYHQKALEVGVTVSLLQETKK